MMIPIETKTKNTAHSERLGWLGPSSDAWRAPKYAPIAGKKITAPNWGLNQKMIKPIRAMAPKTCMCFL
jgi:hypothetical protein